MIYHKFIGQVDDSTSYDITINGVKQPEQYHILYEKYQKIIMNTTNEELEKINL